MDAAMNVAENISLNISANATIKTTRKYTCQNDVFVLVIKKIFFSANYFIARIRSEKKRASMSIRRFS